MPDDQYIKRPDVPHPSAAGLAADCSSSSLRGVVHELANLLDGAARMVHVAERGGQRLDGPALEAVCAALDSACQLLKHLPESSAGIQVDTAIIDDLPSQIRHAVELLRPMAAERGIELVEYAESSLSSVPASPLHAVLVNVVRNAIEAVGEKGRVEVRAVQEGGEGNERARVRIEVIDDGPGPPESLSGKEFEAGATTKQGGAGIGLALVRDTVRSLGGDVTLERVGEAGGARVAIVYPVPRSPVHCPVRGESDRT